MNEYAEKLRDPRWQKKRLKILERDNWTCRNCGATEKTLIVNHLKYDGEPWEVDDEFLETLCEDCNAEYTALELINECLGDNVRFMARIHCLSLKEDEGEAAPKSLQKLMNFSRSRAVNRDALLKIFKQTGLFEFA